MATNLPDEAAPLSIRDIIASSDNELAQFMQRNPCPNLSFDGWDELSTNEKDGIAQSLKYVVRSLLLHLLIYLVRENTRSNRIQQHDLNGRAVTGLTHASTVYLGNPCLNFYVVSLLPKKPAHTML